MDGTGRFAINTVNRVLTLLSPLVIGLSDPMVGGVAASSMVGNGLTVNQWWIIKCWVWGMWMNHLNVV